MSLDGAVDADALTEKEWREMRRRMTSLQFEPVPETPALLPRSLYGDSDGDRSARREETGDDDDALHCEEAAVRGGASGGEEALEAPPTTCSSPPMEDRSGPSLDEVDRVDASTLPPSAWSLVEPSDPWFSSACIASPTSTKATRPLTAASLKSSKRRSTSSPRQKLRRASATTTDHATEAAVAEVVGSRAPSALVDLADLDTAITNAQDQLRLTILSAVHETTARHERDAALDRRKLEAAHANRVALLQSQLDELNETTRTQHQEARGAAQTLERATRLMMTWKQRERERGRARACLEAWKRRWQHKKQQRTQQHVATQCQHQHAQQRLLQQWKLRTQQNAFEQTLEAQRDEHARAMTALHVDYAAQLEQLTHELQSAQENAADAQHGRQQLEGDLRQVFLRGVSAMNIEALTLFKTNHQQRSAQLQEREQQDQPSPQQRAPPHVHFQGDDRHQGLERGKREDAIHRTPSAAGATGGESSEELPSDERMVPIKPPAETVQDPVRQRLQALLPSELVPAQPATSASTQGSVVMPSSVVASRLLKHAGSCEVVSSSTQPFTDSTSAPAPPPAPPTAALHGLRSAELVEAHQRLLHATASRQPATSSPSIDALSGRSLSPAQQRLKAQSSMQFTVEMEFMRSSVAAAAALSARYPVAATASSPSRRPGSLRGSSLATATATSSSSSLSSSRRTSFFSSSSSSTKSTWPQSPS